MTAKKKLGMGLDLLLSAVDNRPVPVNDKQVPAEITALYEMAVDQDEKGNQFEAYHLYRRVTESLEIMSADRSAPSVKVISQAYNNLAVILCDANRFEQALEYLQKAIEIWPQNQTARENYEAVKEVNQ